MNIPKWHELIVPTVKVLEQLGGSGTIEEISDGIIQHLKLPEEDVFRPVNPEATSQTLLDYRLIHARIHLKKYGLIDNSRQGVWAFTDQYQRGMEIRPEEIGITVKGVDKNSTTTPPNEDPGDVLPFKSWREDIHKTILSIDPNAFERLTKRLLREIGFVQVEVTGKSGDCGIDGKGIVKIQDVLSYHVVFQCKRYRGSVGSAAIRDFRGAMVGRADKGLFITTGSFTSGATKEATRDGAAPIDLIDGNEFGELLKKFKLGVSVQMVEEVEVDNQWFEKI